MECIGNSYVRLRFELCIKFSMHSTYGEVERGVFIVGIIAHFH